MSNLYYSSKYKNTIIDILIQNNDFVKLINPNMPPNKKMLQKEMLLGGIFHIDGKEYKEQGHIFDHNFIKNTTTSNKTFVIVETDIDEISQNAFVHFNLYIFIFTEKSLVRITDNTIPSINDIEKMGYHTGYYGNRIDILCDIVDKTLNGNKKLKGICSVHPAPRGFCRLYSPNDNYYGKCLNYKITNYNDGGNCNGN